MVRKENLLRHRQGSTSTFPKLNVLWLNKSWVIHRNVVTAALVGPYSMRPMWFSWFQQWITYTPITSQICHLNAQWETKAQYGQSWPEWQFSQTTVWDTSLLLNITKALKCHWKCNQVEKRQNFPEFLLGEFLLGSLYRAQRNTNATCL